MFLEINDLEVPVATGDSNYSKYCRKVSRKHEIHFEYS